MLVRILFCLLAMPLTVIGQITLKHGGFTNGFGKGTDGVHMLKTMLGPSGAFSEPISIDIYSVSGGLSYCPGESFDISFNITGQFLSGNRFVAQLSDASGSFMSPTNIGTFTSTSSGSISAVIPLPTPPASSYRVRVVSSEPVVIGNTNARDMTVHGVPSATLVADATICSEQVAELNVAFTGEAPWSGIISDGLNETPFGSSSSPLLVPVSPVATTEYVVVSVNDANCVGTVSNSGVITINTPPTIHSVASTLDPQPIGEKISVTVWFGDPDNDPVEGLVDWGDGSVTRGTLLEDRFIAEHEYISPDVYSLAILLRDECGETAHSGYEYAVIYDPSAGFVTGGGWFDSPPGAYIYDTQLTGKVSFGFFSNYKKGSTIPQGNTDLQFHSANLRFNSTQYEWLVIAGYKAMYKGSGMLNGIPGYGFSLSAIDGEKKSSASPDKLRIKIWDPSGLVVYDNQMNATDDAEATTILGAGSIVIHDGKSSNVNSTTSENPASVKYKEIETATVHPNPFADAFTVEYHSGIEGALNIQLLDVTGKTVYHQSHELNPRGIYSVDLEGTTGSGLYLLKISQGYGVKLVRLIKK